ncbi:hypothetical protein LCM08_16535 [Salipiger pacificus]|nr:hypothetical protein [Alloyangia pacifica]MCA0946531.1 hypothetical protein [Alloyangia pacifica]
MSSPAPSRRWIGGTSVYFMTEDGGQVDQKNLLVTEIEAAEDARPVLYEGEELPSLTMGRFERGLSVILIPAFSRAHETYAIGAAEFPGLFDQPFMGWITGVALDDLERVRPMVFDSSRGTAHEDGALVLHVKLPADPTANVEFLNLFEQDGFGPEISFTGPVTFGEIAYILLNQTMVRLQLHGQEQAPVA